MPPLYRNHLDIFRNTPRRTPDTALQESGVYRLLAYTDCTICEPPPEVLRRVAQKGGLHAPRKEPRVQIPPHVARRACILIHHTQYQVQHSMG